MQMISIQYLVLYGQKKRKKITKYERKQRKNHYNVIQIKARRKFKFFFNIVFLHAYIYQNQKFSQPSVFHKQNSQKQFKSENQLDKSSLKSNNDPSKYNQQFPKTNYQANPIDYNSNHTNYNSNYNTSTSIQKNQQKSEKNQEVYSKNDTIQISNSKSSKQIVCSRTSQQQINCNSSQNSQQQNSQNKDDHRLHQSYQYSKQNSNINNNRDSVFSKKSKQHEIDEFDENFHVNYDTITFKNNILYRLFLEQLQYKYLLIINQQSIKLSKLFVKQFNFSQNSEDEYQDQQSIENQTPNLNISKKLEKDNLSISKSGIIYQQSDQKSYQEFCEPCQKTQESEKKESSQVQKKKVKRRKRSRIPKNFKYYLDIIEEQSNDYYTPDKSLLESSEYLDTIQSVPNFGESEHHNMSYRSDRKHFTISEGNQIKMRTPNTQDIKEELLSSDSYDHPNSTLINQTLVNFEDIDQILSQVQSYKALRYKNQEEEAILASWNRVCNEIIRKNLLPVTLDLERIQNQLEIQQQNQNCQKRYQLFNAIHRNFLNHTQKTEQNSFVGNSCFIEPNQQQLEKSESEIQVDDNDDIGIGLLNKQFSPNFSDVCKRIQFIGSEEPKILLGKATSPKDLPNVYMYNTNYEQLLNYQF